MDQIKPLISKLPKPLKPVAYMTAEECSSQVAQLKDEMTRLTHELPKEYHDRYYVVFQLIQNRFNDLHNKINEHLSREYK